MRVRMKVTISGTHNGETWPPIGGTVDVVKGLGEKLVAAGMAEKVEAEVETATADPGGVESAAVVTGKKRTVKSR